MVQPLAVSEPQTGEITDPEGADDWPDPRGLPDPLPWPEPEADELDGPADEGEQYLRRSDEGAEAPSVSIVTDEHAQRGHGPLCPDGVPGVRRRVTLPSRIHSIE